MKKILLFGNPNVGKSVIFSRLTGIHIISSNYPGTTVEFTKGKMKVSDETYELIDAPGIYSLNPISKAEEVAAKLLEDADIVINVMDATNLERSLFLTLQLIKSGKKMISLLNFWDETKHTGIKIDVKKLEKILGIPVIPTCALTGEGIKELVERLSEARESKLKVEEEHIWDKVGEIVKEVQKIYHRHHTFLEKLADLSIKPVSGIILGIAVLAATFYLVRFIGENLIEYVFNPLFELYLPLLKKIASFLAKNKILYDILIGKLPETVDDFVESFGLLTTGIYVPIAMVLPYVFSFYFILGILEDFGWLPRFAILLDNIFHRLGLHGLAVIPMMLGFGCNVPGVMATRVLETLRQRFIAIALLSITIPCSAQIAMIFGLSAKLGLKGIFIVFLTLFLFWILLGLILNRFLKGESPEIFTEIPPYRLPHFPTLFKKLWLRMKRFLLEAVPFVFIGVLFANLLYTFGIMSVLAHIFSPVLSKAFGLPGEAILAILIGFLRKDAAIGMLLPLNLMRNQLIVASVILTMFFPCIATFITIWKELGFKNLLFLILIMIVSSLTAGSLLHLILGK